MKTFVVTTFSLFIFIALSQQLSAQSISIQEAVKQKKILYKLSGSWPNDDEVTFQDANGQYFGKCMRLNLLNASHDTLWIMIDNGLMLLCDDSTVQDMIVTKSIYIDLLPQEGKTYDLYAMCSEIKDKMPQQSTSYKIGHLADDKLRAITHMIENQYMQNIIGQGAVWAYTDHATESDLKKYGANDYTLGMTSELLTRSGTATPFNRTQDSLTQIADVPEVGNEEYEGGMQSPTITIDLYVFYGATGILFILFGITIYVLIKKRNKKDSDLVQ